jgi:hypothetical protein
LVANGKVRGFGGSERHNAIMSKADGASHGNYVGRSGGDEGRAETNTAKGGREVEKGGRMRRKIGVGREIHT